MRRFLSMPLVSRTAAVVKLAKEIEESCVVFVDAFGLPDGSYGDAREGD